MDIQGKIICACELRQGVSQRNGSTWKAQDFVLETMDAYPRKCVFTVWGEDKLAQFNLNIGDEVTVSIDIDAHEYNGRWYNSIRAWKVQRGIANTGITETAPTAQSATNVEPIQMTETNPLDAPAPIGETSDDLPF